VNALDEGFLLRIPFIFIMNLFSGVLIKSFEEGTKRIKMELKDGYYVKINLSPSGNVELTAPITNGTLLNGNFVNGEGLELNYFRNKYTLGDTNNTYFEVDGVGGFNMHTEQLNYFGTNLITTLAGSVTDDKLLITINGNAYYILLRSA
jgi:hypothetical protein